VFLWETGYGRVFTFHNGNGQLSDDGFTDENYWPLRDGKGAGYRGGNFAINKEETEKYLNVIKDNSGDWRIYYIPTSDLAIDGGNYIINVTMFGASSTSAGCELSVGDVGFKIAFRENLDGDQYWFMQDGDWKKWGIIPKRKKR
jgi:hypothetical protein